MSNQPTTFSKVKEVIEQQKQKKIQGEARLESLEAEEKRIFAEIQELTGEDLQTIDQANNYLESFQSSIQEDVAKLREVIESEGIDLS